MSETKLRIRATTLAICTSLSAACMPTSPLHETLATASVSKQRVSFADETEVTVHSEIKLESNALAGFNGFQRTGGVYGAMYVTEDGRAFSWQSRRFSVEDAKAAAQVDCEAFYQRGCVLYATLGPTKLSEGNVFIPDQNRSTWENAVRETQTGNYIAIATSKTGASGFAWDFSSASEARTAALETCKGNTTAKSKETVARVVTANEKAGIYKCRTFGTFR